MTHDGSDWTEAQVRHKALDPAPGLCCGPVFICFPYQGGGGSTTGVSTVGNGAGDGRRVSCDGEGCRAEAQQVDGWLFVGDGGEQRHYCRACLVPYLESLRERTTP